MSKIAKSATVKEDTFGVLETPEGKVTVKRFTFTNENGGQLQVIDYGATITSIKVPDRSGKLGDVVLGFDDVQGYVGASNPFFGSTVGRVANRTKEGKFTLEGKSYQLSINNGPNHLHGGTKGFDKRVWESRVEGNRVIVMSYLSSDGEEGYPGHLLVNVRFEWTRENELKLTYGATTTKVTPVNLTNHSYFNLAGHAKGGTGLDGHWIQINADNYTPVDENMIPTGEIVPVEGTANDFRSALGNKSLTQLLAAFPPGTNGYDNNFCLNDVGDQDLGLVAIVQESGSGRGLVIYSDQPAVQFYTGNFIPEGDKGIKGKEGAIYRKHGAFCLETQNYPDAINHKNFPNGVLLPGEVYKHRANFKFFTSVKST